MCSYSYLILYITSSALSTPTSETSELLKYFKLILFKTDKFELCTCLGQYGINQAGRPRRGLNLWVWSKADAASDPNRSIWFIVKSSSGHRGRSFNPQISLQIQAFPPGQEPATVPVPVVHVVHPATGDAPSNLKIPCKFKLFRRDRNRPRFLSPWYTQKKGHGFPWPMESPVFTCR